MDRRTDTDIRSYVYDLPPDYTSLRITIGRDDEGIKKFLLKSLIYLDLKNQRRGLNTTMLSW